LIGHSAQFIFFVRFSQKMIVRGAQPET